MGLRVEVPVGVMVRRLPPLPTETKGFADVVEIDEVVEAKAVVEVKSVAPEIQSILRLENRTMATYL
jgi:hypothetical protein